MSYSSYDHDNLETAETMKIERRIYFESEKSDLSGLAALPLSELLSMRSESAAAEQAVFDRLKEQAAAWEEQAGKTLTLDKAIEYARTPPAKHTSNQWEAPDSYRHVRSNAVYQMSYSISENTRYDSKAQKSIPYRHSIPTISASALRARCRAFRAAFTSAPKVSKPGQSSIFAI